MSERSGDGERAEVDVEACGRKDGTRIDVRDRRFLAIVLGNERLAMSEKVSERRWWNK